MKSFRNSRQVHTKTTEALLDPPGSGGRSGSSSSGRWWRHSHQACGVEAALVSAQNLCILRSYICRCSCVW